MTYTVSDRSANPGYAVFQFNSERVDILANVFPVLLFAIASLVSLTTMTRFVEEERISIGTTRGYNFLPKMIFEAYVANSTISNSSSFLTGRSCF